MKPEPLKIVIIGLSITSSWGNGHATTYRGLVKALSERGHRVLFLERDLPWYAENRDQASAAGKVELYKSLDELREKFAPAVRSADLVMVGSYVPDGAAVGEWVLATASGAVAFYDIDTPVTLARLAEGDVDYLTADQIRRYHLYLSFTGGPTLDILEKEFGSPMARPLYCSVDPKLYYPEKAEHLWDLGYMGTYSDDRQPALDRLLIAPAKQWMNGRFVVAGPQYPKRIRWPENVERRDHVSPKDHRKFYNQQKFTLNVTRANMVQAGYSPSVRLFEAAACGVPIISDHWEGLETFFEPGEEILVARFPEDILRYIREIPESERREFGEAARKRALAEHTAVHRAQELEHYIAELISKPAAADTASAL